MKFPSKITKYSESTISSFNIILKILKKKEYAILELYQEASINFADISVFIETLECLYVLDAIEYDKKKECLRYAL